MISIPNGQNLLRLIKNRATIRGFFQYQLMHSMSFVRDRNSNQTHLKIKDTLLNVTRMTPLSPHLSSSCSVLHQKNAQTYQQRKCNALANLTVNVCHKLEKGNPIIPQFEPWSMLYFGLCEVNR